MLKKKYRRGKFTSIDDRMNGLNNQVTGCYGELDVSTIQLFKKKRIVTWL